MFGIFGKPGWLLLFLAGAFLIPYVLLDERLGAAVNRALGRAKDESATIDRSSDIQEGALAKLTFTTGQGQSSSGPPLCDMATAFRFDVTPQWVTDSWPRVTTSAGDASYTGLRVPLVTGVMPDDLVGTLTYYFDREQRLQRITFSGNTGDPRRFVGQITGQYRLAPQSTLDAGLYQSKWNGKVVSSLRIQRAAVVSASATHGNFDVTLDLRRADALAGTASAPKRLLPW